MGLYDLARARGVAPESALKKALEIHRQSGLGLAHVLVEAGVITPASLVALLAEETGVTRYDPARATPTPADVRRLPWVLTARRRILVLGTRPGTGEVIAAFTDPTDELARTAAEQALQARIFPLLTDEDTFEHALRHYFGEGVSKRALGPVAQGFTDVPPVVLGEHLSLGDDDDFLTESTDEALQTLLPALQARQGGAGVGDDDLDWLMSKQTGQHPARRERASTSADQPPLVSSAVLSELPGAPTEVMNAPSFGEVANTHVDRAPRRGSSSGAGGGASARPDTGEGPAVAAPELTSEGGLGELTGPPTLVDDHVPQASSDDRKEP